MLNKVSQYIEKESLLTQSGKYIVALSGGADSVALLRVMLSLKYHVEAAHCNFHLRGKESDRDEFFTTSLCNELSIPLHVAHFNTLAYAEERKISIEMAARELRYDWFAHLNKELNADGILVAHHIDDSVETILINLIRGTGVNGLVGIRPKNGDIIRPLLCVSRIEIIEYLQSIKQDYITDSSNLKDDVVRNKLRLNIIPLLKEINPAFVKNVQKTADNIADSIYNTEENELFNILKNFGFNGTQVREISSASNSSRKVRAKMWQTKNFELILDKEALVITRRYPKKCSKNWSKLEINITTITPDFKISKSPSLATIDADKVALPLTLRKIKQGDRFIPFGMNGSKLVSDYLSDIKMPLLNRRHQLVVEDADGRIVWLVNNRTDNRFRITQSTKTCIRLSIRNTNPQ